MSIHPIVRGTSVRACAGKLARWIVGRSMARSLKLASLGLLALSPVEARETITGNSSTHGTGLAGANAASTQTATAASVANAQAAQAILTAQHAQASFAKAAAAFQTMQATQAKAQSAASAVTGPTHLTGSVPVPDGFGAGGLNPVGGANPLGGLVTVTASSTTSATVTLSSATLPSNFGVGSQLLGATVQSVSGATVTLSADANAAVANQTEIYSTGPAIQLIQLSSGAKSQLALGGSGSVTLPNGTPGADQITVSGAGTVTSQGGSVTSTAGSVTTSTGGTLAATAGGTISLTAGSSTLSLSTATTLTSTLAGTIILSAGGGTVPLAANQAETIPAGSTITFTGTAGGTVSVTGPATVALTGAGTLALANATSASSGGTITTTSGTTSFTNGGLVSSLAAGSQINVVGSGTISLSGTTDGSTAVTLPIIVPTASSGLSAFNFTTTGTVLSTQGYNLPTLWSGVGALSESKTSSGGVTSVTDTVTQSAAEALLYWTSFNIGKNTTLDFDQSAGGASAGSWVAINQIVNDPSLAPSQILGSIQAPGRVYVIDQNGIIFGGSSQINTHALFASSLPINTNLLSPEDLLGGSTTQDQFLFSQLLVPSASGVTNPLPAFNPNPGNVISVVSSSATSSTVTLASPIAPAGFGVGSILLGSTVQSINGATVTLAANANVALTNAATAYSTTAGGFAIEVASASPTGRAAAKVTLASTVLPAGFGVGSQLLGATVVSISGTSVILSAAVNAKVTNMPEAFTNDNVALPNDGDIVVQAGAQLTSPTNAEHVGGTIALIGPVVDNEGTISTPDGQTILAAGLQVGFTAHDQTDPSLRGLDVFVGQVGTASDANNVADGTVINNGLIDSDRADITLTGSNINQNGIISSLTSVALNGRIDLLADYNAVESLNGAKVPIITPSTTGTVTLGADSITEILPDTTGDTEVATSLALPSLVNIEAQTIHLAGDPTTGSGAELLAPGAAAVAASTTDGIKSDGTVDLTGAALTSGVNLTAGNWVSLTGVSTPVLSLVATTGQVDLDAGATIDVSGSQDVAASVAENIVAAQLRGTELADSPLQQDGPLRGQTVDIDVRDSGVYNGVAWIGSPIGDLSGYAGLVQHTVNELTVNGGTVGIEAGGSVNIASGATVNVSGGWVNYQGAMVQTTKVVTAGGTILDISQATPDQIYQGIEAGFTLTSPKWGVTQTFSNSATDPVYDPGYIQGGNAGALSISAPTLAMHGSFYGNTVAGVRQTNPTQQVQISEINSSGATELETVTGLSSFAKATFTANASTPDNNFMSQILLPIDATPTPGTLVLNLFSTPEDVVFQPASGPALPNPFAAVGNQELDLSSSLIGPDGFGNLSINGNAPSLTNYNATSPDQALSMAGNIALPAGVMLATQVGGSITLAGVNIDIEGAISSPGGSLSFTTQNLVSSTATGATSAIQAAPGRGDFVLGSAASLSTAGLIVDNLANSPTANTLPLATTGGSVTIKSLNADLKTGSMIDASGGVLASLGGAITYGSAGKIDIEAGQDPGLGGNYAIVGGIFHLGSTLTAYSGASGGGGALTIIAPAVQVGGATLQNGDTSGAPVQENSLVWDNGTSLWLDRAGAPDFFSQGGFSTFSITGLGLTPITYTGGYAAQFSPYVSTPGVFIAPDTTVQPVAQSYDAIVSGFAVGLSPTSYALASQRNPVSLTFTAAGVSAAAFSPQLLVVRGDLVMGQGATIETDPKGSVTLKGQTATVLGHVYAPGGSISVSGASDSKNLFNSNTGSIYSASDIAPTVDLGPESILSTAGTGEVTYNTLGYNTGTIIGGGTITVSGNIVTEQNSLLDVSGASAAFDVTPAAARLTMSTLNSPRMVPITETSSGGTITFKGQEELFVDSTLVGAAGGAGAQPGSLSISNGFSNYSATTAGAQSVQTALDATLVVDQTGLTRVASLSGLAVIGQQVTAANSMLDVDGNAILGYFSANTNLFSSTVVDPSTTNNGGVAGGIGSLTLNGTVEFAGPVSIHTSDKLIVGSNPGLSPNTKTNIVAGGILYANAPVDLSSAYIQLGLPFAGPSGTVASFAPSSGSGSLTVAATDLIDVGNLQLQGIDQLTLSTAGDIRGDGDLYASGTIAITAAQIYPTTDTTFTIAAFDAGTRGSSVTISGAGASLPALPLSGGGTLNVFADTINQDGVVRAPLGTINLGSTTPPTGIPATTSLTLGSTSVTSVSAIDPNTGAGITIPYGSIDSNGNWIDPAGNPITAGSNPTLPAKAVNLAASTVTDDGGSTIDVRGGGDLQASQFVQGTGGLIDILGSTASFAILPSVDQASYAAFDSDAGYSTLSYSNLQVGDQVYLSASADLAAGYYTLLPARYADLPGAFLVTPKSGAPILTAVTETGGSILVSGYRTNSFDGTSEQAVASLFEIDSAQVIQSRAEYLDASANSFFPQSAAALNVATPRLPIDAGQVVFQATQSLTIPSTSGSLLAQPGDGGLGSIVDIATTADINIYNTDDQKVAGDLNLNSTSLTDLGVGSLLVGGFRNAADTVATVTTNSLSVDNQGDSVPLSATDLILVSNGLLEVAPGAVIAASAGLAAAQPLEIENGDNNTVSVASSISGNPTVTLASTVLPAGFGVGAQLLGSTVTSISGATVTLAAGANASVSGQTHAFSTSDGALLRVSSAASAVTSRPFGVVTADPSPKLSIGQGATTTTGASINGTSVTLDSTGSADFIDPSTALTASGTASISSGQISLVLDNNSSATGLVLSGAALSYLQTSASALSLLSYSSLDIYGIGSIGAAPIDGKFQVQSLALHAAEIRGFDNATAVAGSQQVTINAQNVLLDNSANGAVVPGSPQIPATGSVLQINADTITLGVNSLVINQYAKVGLTAASAIVLTNGSGSLSAAGDLALDAALLTSAPIVPLTPLQELNGLAAPLATNQTIRAGGALTLANSGGAVPTLSEGLGSNVTLLGASVTADNSIQLPSGTLSLVATSGDVNVGGNLDLSGRLETIYSLAEDTPGGQVNLSSYAGDVNLNSGSIVNVSAPAGGGNAGTVAVSAPAGTFTFAGATLLGQGGAGGLGGTFSLDTDSLAGTSLSPLEAALNPAVSGAVSGDTYLGGFTQAQTIRIRNGDITLDGITATDNFNLSADSGSITVTGQVVANSGQTDASGASTAIIDVTTTQLGSGILSNPGGSGGAINLEANGSVTLASGAVLSVAAQTVNDAGQGGAVTLAAGAESNGTEPSTSSSRDANTNLFGSGVAVVDIQTGSVIDLSVAQTSKMFDGSEINGTTGTLDLRAPQTTSNTDVQIDPVNGTVINPSSIVVEGSQIFNATSDGSIDNQEAAVMANGNTFIGTAGQPASSTYTAMLNAVISSTGPNSGWQGITTIEPDAEIINTNLDTTANPNAGDLTLASNWDLSTYRFGPNNAAGDLTVRTAGNIVLNFGASLSDGFTANPNSSLAIYGLWSDVLMSAGPSWSYRIVSGADLSAADDQQVLPISPTNPLVPAPPHALAANSGSLVVGAIPVGATAPASFTAGDTTAFYMSTFNAGLGYYQTIRTGTGNIDLASGRDVQLLNNVATIYTAGSQASTPTGFDVPILTDPTEQGNSNYNFPAIGGTIATAQYSQTGGNLSISAQGDIAHYITYDPTKGLPIVAYDINGNPLMADSSKELPTNWLYRRGFDDAGTFAADADGQVASTTWWVDFNNFFEGVGALGGGNVTLNAGGNIRDVDAVVPTNAYMSPDAAGDPLSPTSGTFAELGGGDLVIHAANNIDGGVYYVERGNATLTAGDSITTDATRNVVSVTASPDTDLPTTYYLGKGTIEVAAQGDLLLGPTVNAFLLPQGINNTVNDKSYFSTYAATDTVIASSLTGAVTLQEAFAPSSPSESNLVDFYNQQLSFGGFSNFAATAPWLGLVEEGTSSGNLDPFNTVFGLMPPSLKVTAFSGDIDLEGNLTLSPSAIGTVDLAAAGSVNAFQPISIDTSGNVEWGTSQINLSDANPNSIPGPATPLSYAAGGRISLATTNSGLFSPLDSLFEVSGSTTGAFALLTTQQTLHANLPIDPSDPNSALGPLHAADPNPVQIYAATGDIDGLELFSGKFSDLVAGSDVTDVSLYVQNVNPSDITLVEAGRDIIPYDVNSLLREDTHLTGGLYFDEQDDPTQSGFAPNGSAQGAPNTGDIQIAGPGTLEVLAGRNLTLGDGPNNGDGTGLGIVSIGNTVDPYLPFSGADIIGAAGLGGSVMAVPNLGTAAFGLDASANSALNYTNSSGTGFIDQFLNPSSGGAEAARYLPDLGTLLGVTGLSNAQIWDIFSGAPDSSLNAIQQGIQAKLTPESRDALATTIFYDVLRDAGRDHNNPNSPDFGMYTEGYDALQALLPSSHPAQGDISLTAREVKTTNGGDISLLAPGGGVDVGVNNSGTQAIDQGILTVSGGNISIYTQNSVSVGTSRIFTLHGGNIIIWSTDGNIAAGASSKTVQSAPPTRVLIDTQSGNVENDLAGLATGGGIGVLETVAGAPPGNVDLIAPSGVIDAGDAGIRSSGNINLAATQVLNASNIQSSGSTSGVAATPTPNIGATVAASSAAASSQGAANEGSRPPTSNQSQDQALPSIISVEVIGYSSGDSDSADTESPQQDSLLARNSVH